MRAKACIAALLVASAASAQDVKETCPQASERAQRMLDERRMLEARAAFLSCAQDSCPAAVRRDCRAQLDEMKKTLPSIVIHVLDQSHSDIAHGAVTLDGTKIGELDGRTLEVDPGTHKIHVELPDGRVYDRQVIVAAGEQSRSIMFDSNAASLGAGVPNLPFEHKEQPQASGGWSTVKTLGLVSMIVGGVGLVVGGFFLAIDVSNVGTAGTSNPNECPLQPNPDTCTKALNAAKNLDEPLMFAAGISGLVFLGAGIAMFVVGGNKHPATSWNVAPMVGPKVGGLSFGVSF
jgi:hypothetical protein